MAHTGEPADLNSFLDAEDAGRLLVMVRFGPPLFEKFGDFRGADEGGSLHQWVGRLDGLTADAGRCLFARWLRERRSVRSLCIPPVSLIRRLFLPFRWC